MLTLTLKHIEKKNNRDISTDIPSSRYHLNFIQKKNIFKSDEQMNKKHKQFDECLILSCRI